MKSSLRGLLCAASVLLGATSLAQAAPVAATAKPASDCLFPNEVPAGNIPWFLGLYPTNDLLSTWCHLQTLQGTVKFDVLFPTTNAHHTWMTTFNGVRLPSDRIVDIIQSLLPTKDGPATDTDGQPFSRVLLNVVQLQAKTAPDKSTLDFAPEHPASKELVLWEPLIIRVKPILLAGQEFTLIVRLKPSLGLLALGLEGKATDVRMLGWKGRMSLGNFFTGDCSDLVPICKTLPETTTFHAPWIVDNIELVAEGESMTAAALSIGDQLLKSNAALAPTINPLASFNLKTGDGTFILNDPVSTLTFQATGSPTGTSKIVIRYAGGNGPYSLQKSLEKAGQEYRMSTTAKQKPLPPVPDSLNRL